MAYVKGDVRRMKFTPDETGGGWLEWDELVVRKGFRTRVEHRRIRKEALAAAMTGDRPTSVENHVKELDRKVE